MLWEILVLLVIIWLVQRRWRLRRQIALMEKMKTNLKSYPIIGHAYMFIGTGEDRMKAFQAFGMEALRAGGIAPMWMEKLHICVADPVVCETLLNQCNERLNFIRDIIGFLTGNGSFIASVPIWRPRRKIMMPTFRMKNLIKFAEVICKISIVMADCMEKEVGNGIFSFWKYISECNLDSVTENTLGVSLDTLNDKNQEFKEALDQLFNIAGSRACKPWFHSNFMFKFMQVYGASLKYRDTIRDFVAKAIKDKQELIKNRKSIWTPDERTDEKAITFLDLLLDVSQDQRFTDTELLEEVMVLILAGSDTTATSAGLTAFMLSKHQDIQEKVYTELQDVFGDSDGPVTPKDLPRLKYLEIVIKETIRLFPPVPIIDRQVENDVKLLSGLTIVKGAGFFVNVWAVHRNPKYWGEDVDQFRPERFLNFTPAHPAAFMPFGYGPRSCIGYQYGMMSMKITLATLLRRYRLLPPPGVTKEDPVKISFDIILRHVDRMEMRLENRK